ncbi:MAG: ATP-grasp domain-containing protein [Candidatus Babeliaceae bacterium]|nr:ATP-grasp domain-containing protein [Candidatus Babeliaceae bacterium]
MTKISVGVFMGGMSLEKEVSFNSGRTVCDHLDKDLYTVVPIFQTVSGTLYILPQKFLYRGKISDFEHRLTKEAQHIAWHDLKNLINIAFIAQHGRFGEDGCLQATLEIHEIPYVGTKVFGSALGMDKFLQKFFLNMHGIQTAHGICVQPENIEKITHAYLNQHTLDFPLVVKPVHEGSSFGVSIVHDIIELKQACYTAASISKHMPENVIIEEKINGMEFSCIVLQDSETGLFSALSVTEIVKHGQTEMFDYEQKYMPGRATKWTPARCSEQNLQRIQERAAQAAHALEFCTIGRIDGFLKDNGDIVIIDPNSLSGLAPSSFAFVQAAQKKLNHKEFINKLLEAEMKKNQPNTKKTETLLEHSSHKIAREPHKTVIAVVFGGASHEREISLESGRNIIYKLSSEKYQVLPIFVSRALTFHFTTPEQLVLNSTQEIENSLEKSQQWSLEDIKINADFVFIALHGGQGENGVMQGTLEMLKIPYNGSGVLASALCMDKHKTSLLLKACGFDTPKSVLVPLDDSLGHYNLSQVAYPAVVKPHNDGCSIGVNKVKNEHELRYALDCLKKNGHTYALVEEFITGMELTVGVLGNKDITALPPSAAISTKDILSIEEKFLPGAGENQTPAPLPESSLLFIQRTMEGVYKALTCSGYARIDCFYQPADISPTSKERVIILEVNSLPGLTPATVIFHQAAEIGMSPSELLDTIVQLGFEKHGKSKHQQQISQENPEKEMAVA